jgi:hypothetical protein
MSAAQARIEIIARSFAECGLRDLVMLVHELIRKHSDKEMVVRLRNEWVPVDPRIWKHRYDMTISVGLGTGNREQQMQNLMMVMNVQKEAKAGGLSIVTDENIYNSATKLAEIAGFKSPELFFSNEQQQPQIPPEIQQQIQEQAQQMQEAISKLQQENQKLQQEILKRDTDTSVKVYEVDKRAETEMAKAEMQAQTNMLMPTIEAIAGTITEQQRATSEIANRMQEVEEKEVDFTPLLEAFEALNAKIDNSQPVAIKQVRDANGRLIGGVRVLPDGTEQEITIQ